VFAPKPPSSLQAASGVLLWGPFHPLHLSGGPFDKLQCFRPNLRFRHFPSDRVDPNSAKLNLVNPHHHCGCSIFGNSNACNQGVFFWGSDLHSVRILLHLNTNAGMPAQMQDKGMVLPDVGPRFRNPMPVPPPHPRVPQPPGPGRAWCCGCSSTPRWPRRAPSTARTRPPPSWSAAPRASRRPGPSISLPPQALTAGGGVAAEKSEDVGCHMSLCCANLKCPIFLLLCHGIGYPSKFKAPPNYKAPPK